MDQIFLREPAQSGTARGAGVVPPPAIALAEVKDREVIQDIKRGAEAYVERIENKRAKKWGPSEVEDVDLREATNFNIGCQVAVMMPAIESALPPIAAYTLAQILCQGESPLVQLLNNRFDQIDIPLVQIDRRLRTIELMQKNAAALAPDDDLFAVPTEAGDEPPFDRFTMAGLFSMTSADITLLENYYGMGHGGTLELRRKKILQRIGAIKLQ